MSLKLVAYSTGIYFKLSQSEMEVMTDAMQSLKAQAQLNTVKNPCSQMRAKKQGAVPSKCTLVLHHSGPADKDWARQAMVC